MAPESRTDSIAAELSELENIVSEMDQEITEIESRLLRDSERLRSLKATRSEQAAHLQDLRLQLVSGDEPIVYPKIILVADSDVLNRRFMRNVIEKIDHVPVEARTCKEALAVLRQSPIDLILVDIDMDDMNGLEFVRVVREERGLTDIPVVMMTKALERRHIVAFADHTIQGHLVKPIHRDMVTQVLDDLWASDAKSEAASP